MFLGGWFRFGRWWFVSRKGVNRRSSLGVKGLSLGLVGREFGVSKCLYSLGCRLD